MLQIEKLLTVWSQKRSRNYLENREKHIRTEFEEEGLEVIDLTDEELEVFKEKVKPLREKLKAKYGEEACKAFRIDMDKNFKKDDDV